MLPVLFLGEFVKAKNSGFTVDLIHRDSPLSTLYNPTRTPLERYKNALKWSKNRISTLLSSYHASVETQLISDYGDFIMKFSIGSPPIEFYGIADTGSDLTWTQCNPCISCKEQKYPLFNPKNSTTYKELPCTSEQCQWVRHVCSDQNICEYTYVDNTQLALLLLKLLLLLIPLRANPSPFKRWYLGVDTTILALVVDQTAIFGVGGGPLSLVSQIGSVLGSVKFSQCFVPTQTNSSLSRKLIFGTDVNAEGKGVISTTPLVQNVDKTLYFVTLKGFSVGDKFVPFNAPNGTLNKGNMFIDSGTIAVILPQDLHSRLENVIIAESTLQPIPEARPQLCYRSETEISEPVITAHFDSGAKVRLNPINAFIPVQDGVYCFTVTDTTAEVGIIGNYAQIDFFIGFDLEKKTVSFMPTDCTNNQ
ncbi:hypothetical protein Cgig2_008510 [Carnegiea gigantea]|uniref:Peptidase A1 domain-containing protein n=1 Tax=Carnegiea gigantea TaxID=171969 RepID=A0A9Q1JJI9_9CARY|nr:hypothetical protein Cgig2_008510 [Carnegiea gigantea]